MGEALLGIAERQSETSAFVVLATRPAFSNKTTMMLEEEYERFVTHAYIASSTKTPGECKFRCSIMCLRTSHTECPNVKHELPKSTYIEEYYTYALN